MASFIRRILCSISIDRSNAYHLSAHGVVLLKAFYLLSFYLLPPFAKMISPVSQPASSEARNTATRGLADAAQRCTRDYLLLRLRSHDARRLRTLRFGSTGIESVNADFSGAELF